MDNGLPIEEHAASRGYRMLVAIAPVFIALYTAAVLILPHIGFTKEQYLVYSWFVFPQVPSHTQVSYEAYIISVNGIPKHGERLESSGAFLHDELRNIPDYRRRIRFIGEMMSRRSLTEAEAPRHELESLALARPLTYEIVSVTYNPIERFLRGTVIATSSIGVYTVQ
jgi:hypothetical protein